MPHRVRGRNEIYIIADNGSGLKPVIVIEDKKANTNVEKGIKQAILAKHFGLEYLLHVIQATHLSVQQVIHNQVKIIISGY